MKVILKADIKGVGKKNEVIYFNDKKVDERARVGICETDKEIIHIMTKE